MNEVRRKPGKFDVLKVNEKSISSVATVSNFFKEVRKE